MLATPIMSLSRRMPFSPSRLTPCGHVDPVITLQLGYPRSDALLSLQNGDNCIMHIITPKNLVPGIQLTDTR